MMTPEFVISHDERRMHTIVNLHILNSDSPKKIFVFSKSDDFLNKAPSVKNISVGSPVPRLAIA